MRIVVCLKHVPLLSALTFDPATRRIVRPASSSVALWPWVAIDWRLGPWATRAIPLSRAPSMGGLSVEFSNT